VNRTGILAVGFLGGILLVFGIGCSVYIFAAQRESVSVVSLEPVQLDICLLSSGEKCEEDQLTGLIPGEKVEREPAVILEGDSPEAYIRVSVVFGGALGASAEENEEECRERLERTQELRERIRFCEGWLEGEDGCYYYQKKVTPGSIVPVYEQITIPEDWDNDIAGKAFTLELSAEAVRSEDLEPWLAGAGEIRNWE